MHSASTIPLVHLLPVVCESGSAETNRWIAHSKRLLCIERLCDDVISAQNLAYLYDSKGNEPKAAPLYKRALQLDGTQVAAAVNLAATRMHQGRLEDAIR